MKNKIDERQEQELLKRDHAGFQIMFSVSVIMILIQLLFMKATFQQLIGENVILLCGGIWVIWGYANSGLWNYDNSRPSIQSNLKYSAIFSLVGTVIFGIAIYGRAGSSAIKAPIISGFLAGIFILGFVILSILGRLTEKKENQW
ncbi:DUF6773 family protein [Desulfitobacterium metallireducens]|uniref:Uncharacterized protein n=1 Tax=Desulfitobacterium metallireducens DSM 15288 TaxID=871968 RepID=W0EF46_9FIRM|nr:DUF6773 family protein [Desulfitobacterium metallireducens]AHF08148.1 hypothetical protein DESME_14775 [Desulfitobacterium metallireducens DSM 15288]